MIVVVGKDTVDFFAFEFFAVIAPASGSFMKEELDWEKSTGTAYNREIWVANPDTINFLEIGSNIVLDYGFTLAFLKSFVIARPFQFWAWSIRRLGILILISRSWPGEKALIGN